MSFLFGFPCKLLFDQVGRRIEGSLYVLLAEIYTLYELRRASTDCSAASPLFHMEYYLGQPINCVKVFFSYILCINLQITSFLEK